MKKKKNKLNDSTLVYSTNPDYYKEITQQQPISTPSLPPEKQDLRITLDKKLKGGKKATIIYNFQGTTQDLEELGKILKIRCGVGGSVKDGKIILQGDFLERAKIELQKMGYKVKAAGI
ncbi:MAG: translation initiation factor [Bacteroidia bacterium]|nr:translation initiation factor [Bacteroidia bacterium]MDW8157273.1 translation initiation factor [Bacteroidia bacterium]